MSRLNLEEQLERLKEYETNLHNSEDLRMTKIYLNDLYWMTNHEEVRIEIEKIAMNYKDEDFIRMLEDTKRKFSFKNNGCIVKIPINPNCISLYD